MISPVSTIVETFNIRTALTSLSESYNVAPSQEVLIINDMGERVLITCRWGFLPPWVKDLSECDRLINARAETIDEKPSFRAAFRDHRCLIIADGFYEWKRENGKKKVPYFIRLKSGRPFGFAGIYNYWSSPEGDKICGCAIITTVANGLVAAIHDRMPAILPQDRIDLWLAPASRNFAALKEMLKPYPPEEMEMYKVKNTVNSPKFNSAINILPAED